MTDTNALALIDIGANLTHESFSHDLEAVVKRAQSHGVEAFIVTGADRQSNEEAQKLVQAHPDIMHATAGVHPHHAVHYDEDTDRAIRHLASDRAICAVGEAGLDYNRNYSPSHSQQTAFEKQLAIAIEHQLPVFLHQRDAHHDFLAILKEARDKLTNVVVHCFTDSRKALFDYLDIDCHIGITGWLCDERRGQHLHQLVKAIPANRLMLETDAPYLLPRDIKPKPSHRRNEPMYLAHICQAVAADRGETLLETAHNSYKTTQAFFNL